MGAGVREEEQPLLEKLAKGLEVGGYPGFSLFPITCQRLSLAAPVQGHCHGSLGNTAYKNQHPRVVCRSESEQVRGKE